MTQALPTSRKVRRTKTDSLQPAGQLTVSSARPFRILHIIPDLCVAGAEMKLYKLLAASNRERFAPTVISLRDRGELCAQIEALGIPVHSLGIRGSVPGLAAVRALVRIVRQESPDLIHGWMYHGNLAAQFAAALTRNGPSVLWSIHQSLYTFAYEKWLTTLVIRLGALFSRRPAQIVYVSRTSASQHEAAGYHKERTLVVPYGFDTEKFAPSEAARCACRQELGLSQDALLIGLIGRYHPVKDHANFLQAAQEVLAGRPHVHLVLCGKGVDHENVALRTLVEESQMRNQIHLLGERNDIQHIIAALDIAVSSSRSEGFPNVVGEAMSSGVPCIVTAVSDLPEIVGETGRVVPPQDSAALAVALAEMIAAGRVGRQALGAAARARVIERYTLESSVTRYEGIYESIIDRAKARAGEAAVLTRTAISNQ